MLDNTITLAVDQAGNDTIVSELYTRFEEQLNRSVYIGDDHSLSTRNQMAVTRSSATVSGNFRGVAKSAIKFTQDITVPGVDVTTSNSAPMIGSSNFSIPVGATSAQVMLLRQRMIAGIDHAFAARLTERQEV
jgi:hypothetical protein